MKKYQINYLAKTQVIASNERHAHEQALSILEEYPDILLPKNLIIKITDIIKEDEKI